MAEQKQGEGEEQMMLGRLKENGLQPMPEVIRRHQTLRDIAYAVVMTDVAIKEGILPPVWQIGSVMRLICDIPKEDMHEDQQHENTVKEATIYAELIQWLHACGISTRIDAPASTASNPGSAACKLQMIASRAPEGFRGWCCEPPKRH